MITIYFDDRSIRQNARYSVEDVDGFVAGMSEDGEQIDGQRSVEVETRGRILNVFIIDGHDITPFSWVEDGTELYAFTGYDDLTRVPAEMARLRKVEILARAIIMSGRDDLIGEFDDATHGRETKER